MDNPSGALMVSRKVRIKDKVKAILEDYPSTRGDDRLLQYRFLEKYSPVKLAFHEFEELRRLFSPETLPRRRRELQKEFPELRPLKRTTAKRERAENAERNYYGNGMTLADYANE